jgi:hypothetical protein
MQLNLYSPIRICGMMLNQLNTGKTLPLLLPLLGIVENAPFRKSDVFPSLGDGVGKPSLLGRL